MIKMLTKFHSFLRFSLSTAVFLLRTPNFWRIIGVMHSETEYLLHGVRAKPTPEQNPELTHKIMKLFNLLTKQNSRSGSMKNSAPQKAVVESNATPISTTAPTINSTSRPSPSTEPKRAILLVRPTDANSSKLCNFIRSYPISSTATNGASTTVTVSTANTPTAADSNSTIVGVDSPESTSDAMDDGIEGDPNATEQIKLLKGVTKSNISVRQGHITNVPLPIPVAPNQRWLMMSLGVDFTHIWFPSWRKFLSMKRIRSCLQEARTNKKTIKISTGQTAPHVYVTHSCLNEIFVGPYGMDQEQDLALFVRHYKRILLSENYAKQKGLVFSPKTIGEFEFFRNSVQFHLFTHSFYLLRNLDI